MPVVVIKYSIKKKNQWPSWSGELDELRRLGSLLVKLVEQRGSTLLDAYEQRPIVEPDDLTNYHARRKEEFAEKWVAVAAFQDGDDQIEGPIAEVLDKLDRRSTSGLQFRATSAYTFADGENLIIRFDGTAVFEAVTLQVESCDQGWARQVFTLLSEEVEKGVPRWAWFRSLPGRMVVSEVAALTLGIFAYLLVPSSTHYYGVLIASAVGLVASVVVTFPQRVMDWFLPPFEISSNANASGSRRIAALATVVATVPIGIVVSLLTK